MELRKLTDAEFVAHLKRRVKCLETPVAAIVGDYEESIHRLEKQFDMGGCGRPPKVEPIRCYEHNLGDG